MGKQDELIEIVNQANQVVGSASRRVMRHFNLPHRAVYILVFNSRGEILVHRRAFDKDIYPGCCCPAIGGVVAAGESRAGAASRELFEETGIQDLPLSFLFDFYHEDGGNLVWGRAFCCRGAEEVKLQEEEIESGWFMTIPEVLKLAEQEPFTPDGLYVFRRFLAEHFGRFSDHP